MGFSIGGRRARAKLTEADARNIRLRASKYGHTPRQMAPDYKVGIEAIRKVLRWETFPYTGEEGPGATAADWNAPMAEATPEAVAAFQAKVERLAGIAPSSEGILSTPPFPSQSAKAEGYGARAIPTLPAASTAPFTKPMPTQEESYAAAARESDEVTARVKATFEAKDAAGNAELAGLLGTGGITLPMTNEKAKNKAADE